MILSPSELYPVLATDIVSPQACNLQDAVRLYATDMKSLMMFALAARSACGTVSSLRRVSACLSPVLILVDAWVDAPACPGA